MENLPARSLPAILFENAFRQAPVGLMIIEKDGIISAINQRAKMNLHLNISTESLTERHYSTLFAESEELILFIEDFLKGKRKPYELLEILLGEKYLTVRGNLTDDVLLLSLTDVTRLKDVEMATLNAMLEGQENERKRLGREIHDGIGPLLSTLKMFIESFQPEVKNGSGELRKKYDSVVELTNALTREIRDVSHGLMPNAVEDFGVVAALQNLCDKAEASGKMQIEFFSTGMQERLDNTLELGLYRIGQELLNNAIKHAKAKTITMQIIRHKGSVVLMVEDDGVGFDKRRLRRQESGIGLKNVGARVKSLGGTFSLDTFPGKGVVVSVEIPV